MQAEEAPNTLAARYPEIAAMWHPTLNGDLTAEDVTPGSGKKVWWLCPKGHEWDASVLNRSSKGSGCPYCINKKALAGYNDIATTHPEISAQWHIEINGSLTPTQFVSGSDTKVWWKCDLGHAWEAAIKKRTLRNDGCPYCSNRMILEGFNDLASLYPRLANEWNSDRNGGVSPQTIGAGNSTKFWWQCSKGHEWRISPCSRVKKGANCPVCSGRVPEQGVNDLVTVSPKLAKQWHPNLNGNIMPNDVTINSGRKIWWQCDKGHEWKTAVSHRTNGTGCPVCSNRIIIPGINDLATHYPLIASEWHPTKNLPLLPTQVSYASGEKVWWQCKKGHDWETWVYARHINGCDKCMRQEQSSKGEKEIGQFLQELGFTVEYRSMIPSVCAGAQVELDIYLPNENFAIEFNGVYWHSERNGKGKKYHADKWQASKNYGVTLYQVWEDDWNFRKEIVLRGIAHRLGVMHALSEAPYFLTTPPKIGARSTKVRTLTVHQSAQFLNENHIQGAVGGCKHYGLYDAYSNLRAVMTVQKGKVAGSFIIARYATSGVVAGGFTKLLAFAKEDLTVKEWVTFADRSISNGGLYESNGFVVDGVLPPDYSYLVRGKRVHKFNYRKSRFKKDPNLLYQEGATERELALLNGISRIWDSGKVRYVKKIDKP